MKTWNDGVLNFYGCYPFFIFFSSRICHLKVTIFGDIQCGLNFEILKANMKQK
jgi:hypothetical protein